MLTIRVNYCFALVLLVSYLVAGQPSVAKTCNTSISENITLGTLDESDHCFISTAKTDIEPYQEISIASANSKSSASSDTTHEGRKFSGNISWYGPGFQGKKTASGKIFDMNKLTAAHLKLPFGTRVQVEDPKSGNVVVVEVTDRGPYVKTRVMDVTREAARQLGSLLRGVTYVNCLILEDI